MYVSYANLDPKLPKPTHLIKKFKNNNYPTNLIISDELPNMDHYIEIDTGEFDKFAPTHNIYYRRHNLNIRRKDDNGKVRMFRSKISNDRVKDASSIKIEPVEIDTTLKEYNEMKTKALERINNTFIPSRTHNVKKSSLFDKPANYEDTKLSTPDLITNVVKTFYDTNKSNQELNVCYNCAYYISPQCHKYCPPWHNVLENSTCFEGFNKHTRKKFDV